MKKQTHSESEIIKGVNEFEAENAKLKRMYANMTELPNEGFWKIFRIIRKDGFRGLVTPTQEFQNWCKGNIENCIIP